MIQNLAAYSAWKRSTLDRLTDQYRRLFTQVYARHLRQSQELMEEALRTGETGIDVNIEGIKSQLARVLEQHQSAVVKSAVSDGMREISPERRMSTWQFYPLNMPVEDTFQSLAERRARDSIFETVHGKMAKKYRSTFAKIIDLDVERYRRNVTAIFRSAAESYFKDPDTTTSAETIKDVLRRVLKHDDTSAERLFRTETTKYFNEARIGYFQNHTEVDFVQVVAITDGRISNICESRDGYVIPIGQSGKREFRPPFHWNCRSVLSPLDTDLKSDREEVSRNLGLEFGKVHSETSDEDFIGHRPKPSVPLPSGWL